MLLSNTKLLGHKFPLKNVINLWRRTFVTLWKEEAFFCESRLRDAALKEVCGLHCILILYPSFICPILLHSRVYLLRSVSRPCPMDGKCSGTHFNLCYSLCPSTSSVFTSPFPSGFFLIDTVVNKWK